MTRASTTEQANLQKQLRQLRKHPEIIVGAVVVLTWIILALLAPVIAPFDPLEQNIKDRLQALADRQQHHSRRQQALPGKHRNGSGLVA